MYTVVDKREAFVIIIWQNTGSQKQKLKEVWFNRKEQTMKRKIQRKTAVLLMSAVCILSGCAGSKPNIEPGETGNNSGNTQTELGDEQTSFGEDITNDLYAGYFETPEPTKEAEHTLTPEPGEEAENTLTPEPTKKAENTPTPEPTKEAEATQAPELTKTPENTSATGMEGVTITCVSGTDGCYTVEGNTITFHGCTENSAYAISGQFKGNIVIDAGEDYKFELELQGLSLISDNANPIVVLSGDKVTLTAKKDSQNYIYDTRAAVDTENSEEKAAAIYAMTDLKIAGKGELTVVSENNNGIHTKDDLEVKNLTLTVQCKDNALKGNDSVTLENATATLIATAGDGIMTTNSDISSKGNQRGTISVAGGSYTVYAACDGLDASYDVVIEDASTVLTVFTDKYSNYSEEVTAVADEVYYIRSVSKNWKYSVKYYNSDEDYVWVNADYHSEVSSRRSSYYYYSFPKKEEYSKMQFYIYSSDMEQSQETEYLAVTDYLTMNGDYDTFALESRGNNISYGWTNYTTEPSGGMGGHGGFGGFGGFGGMNDGNTDKGDHSTKGIKAANEIYINAGNITIKSYDDSLHADNSETLENGEAAKGNIVISGGILSLYSNDDGIHADSTVTVADGKITVLNSYEGIEGTNVVISGGTISVNAKDDGINGTATSGTAITISGGNIYIYCSGDGVDSNSRTSYEGIVFSGGNTVIISTSGGNSAIDTEQGYRYDGGSVVAIMPSNGMTQEVTHCKNFSSIGSSRSTTVIAGRYLNVTVGGETVVVVQMPSGLSAKVTYLGSNGASVSVDETTTATLDENGVCWF